MKSMYLLSVALLWPGLALAQSVAENCPELPSGSSLHWEALAGPDFVFCKAMREADGSQVFSVMLRAESTFRPERGLREEKALIDGHKVSWYRGEVATRQDVHIRETLVELGKRNTAHIVLRADSEAQLAENQLLAERLRFRPTSVGGD